LYVTTDDLYGPLKLLLPEIDSHCPLLAGLGPAAAPSKHASTK
jgi:hypothetical protein